MILGIIIGLFIGGCVGVVIMAIVQMAKEDEPVTKNDDKGIEFPCPKCGKGEHHVGYLGFLFCPECGYRTTRGFDLNAATREWNSASVLQHNDSRLPKNCYQCLSTTQYGRALECPAYKKLKEDPLSIDWVNGFYRGTKRVKGKTDCPLDKEDKADLCENDMIDAEGVECFLTTKIKSVGNRYGAGVAFPSNYCVFCEHVDAVIYDTRGGAYFHCKDGHVYDEHNLTCKYFDLKGENVDE